MSHFTRIKTKMVEKTYLIEAIKDLGYAPQENPGGQVSGYAGRRTTAEIVIHTPRSGYDIGFQQTEGSYEIVADWYDLARTINQKDFVERLTQRYAYHTTRAKLEEQGFSLVEEENQQDGRVHLLVRRMV